MMDNLRRQSEYYRGKYIRLEREFQRLKIDGNTETICAFMEQYQDLKKKFEYSQIEIDKMTKDTDVCKKIREKLADDRKGLILEKDELVQQLTGTYHDLQQIKKQHDDDLKEYKQLLEAKTKDLRQVSEQRNSAEEDLRMLLSERDTVLKENQKLSDEYNIAMKKVENLEAIYKDEKQNIIYENECLKREIQSALRCRDDAVKKSEALVTSNIDFKKSRPEFNENWNKELVEVKDSQEIERLKKSLDKAIIETTKAFQEVDVAKGRRDWAISEREKIVQERDSIKALCDELRKERDTAISELLAAIRDSENIKKQKDEAWKEIEQLKDNLESSNVNNDSRWNYSGYEPPPPLPIKADTEIIDIDMSKFPADGDMGLVLEGEDGDVQNNQSCYVLAVAKDSIFDGKLKVNDYIVQVNNLDCLNASKRTILDAIRSSSLGHCTIVVKRQRMNMRHLYATHLNLIGCRNHGLSLETGIYISKIAPGSLASKDGSLAVGDRILSINNKSLEGTKIRSDAMSYLDDSRTDVITIIALKQITETTNEIEIHREVRQNNKMTNSCTQTLDLTKKINIELEGNRHFVPTVPFYEQNSLNNFSTTSAVSPAKPTSILPDFFKKFRGKINQKSNTNDGNDENDAIAVLDSVLNSENLLKKDTVIKRSKKKSKDPTKEAGKSMGTWPRANIIAHDNNTGTIVHHRKKERPALSIPNDNVVDTYFPSLSIPQSNKTNISTSSSNRNSHPIHYHVLSPPPTVVNRHTMYRPFDTEPILGKSSNPIPLSSTLSRATKPSEFDIHHHHYHHHHRMSLNLTPTDSGAYKTNPIGLDFKPTLLKSNQQHSLDFISQKSQNSIDSFLNTKSPPSMDFSSTKPDFYQQRKIPRSAPKYPSDSESLGPEMISSVLNSNNSISSINRVHAPSPRTQALFSPSGPLYPHPHPHPHMRHVSPSTVTPTHPNDNSGAFDRFESYGIYHSHGASIDYPHEINKHPVTRDRDEISSGYSHGYEGGTFPRKKENQRFRIPSNISVASKGSGVKNSTGSIEHHGSERGSPMPSFQVEVLSHGTNTNKRNSMPDYCLGQKPNIGDLRRITIDKSVEPLGITIRCNNNGGGIFVSTVSKNCIASQVGVFFLFDEFF